MDLTGGRPDPSPIRPSLISGGLVRVLVASGGAMASFYLLLSVVPLYATTAGAGEAGAGVSTGALLLATVAAEFAAPWLIARFGYRLVFGVGLVLLGAPVLVLPGSAELSAIVVISAVRGLGFGIVVVLGNALVASLVPAERRGEGIGLYGIVVGLASVVALPSGVFLVGQFGYPPVFLAGAIAALVGLLVVAGLPGRVRPPPVADSPAAGPAVTRSVGLTAGLRDPLLLRPVVVFSVIAVAGGVLVTFLPLALANRSGNLAVLGLLVYAMAATGARWWAGRYGDRHGPGRLLVPALLVAATGILLLVAVPNPAAVLVGVVLFGAGFGASQNASLALMFSRVSSARYGTVSALWNLGYDAGMGLGAAGFGLLVVQTGYSAAFALTGALMLVAVLPGWRDRAVARR